MEICDDDHESGGGAEGCDGEEMTGDHDGEENTGDYDGEEMTEQEMADLEAAPQKASLPAIVYDDAWWDWALEQQRLEWERDPHEST